ncbi:uncharacterized protein LDX57_006729 [Aspergillus melleus]|uniref:uncharacterized protein n=1 Tax=Aspergillus melleus TaxID=138277 RepID=UPI001E8EADCB|nr:uncharacterized protein LDX57_006729 [Aspergillus melleus]KAH8429059.1 hypothetical protein LDX57_006729 [Aspergillus melleus]
MYVTLSSTDCTTIVQSTIPPPGLRPSMSKCTIVKSELLDLSSSDTLTRSTIHDSSIKGGRFAGAESQTRIYNCDIANSKLNQVSLERSIAQNAKMSKVHDLRSTIQGSEVNSSSLRRNLLHGSRVVGSWLSRSETQGSHIVESRVRRSDIRGSRVRTSRLDRATVQNCQVSNSLLLRGDYQNKDIHNEIWQNGRFVGSTREMNQEDWMMELGSESEEEGELGDEMESSISFLGRRNREHGRDEGPPTERELEREQVHYDDPPPPYSP